jgi:hypothetical protein
MAAPLQDYLDDYEGLTAIHQRDLYAHERHEVEAFRLAMVQRRFHDLRNNVTALTKFSALKGVDHLRNLEDVVPLLFPHTVYKSYPMTFLERGRFDLLTRWFNQLTAYDLSEVDIDSCGLVEDWFKRLEEATGLAPIHTTGTSGKLSFLPRAKKDFFYQHRCVLARWQGVGREPDITLDVTDPGVRLPVIQPGYQYGYYMAQRLMAEQLRVIGDPDQVEAFYGDQVLSPDVLSLSGRVATAATRGELETMSIAPELLRRFKQNQEVAKNKADLDAEFFERVLSRFEGKRVMVGNTVPQLYAWAAEGRRRGVKSLFAPDSLIGSGGGAKGTVLPDDWRQQIEVVVGAPLSIAYGMSELCCLMNQCSEGHYHVPPYLIVFVLDEITGQPRPRTGVQTGRAAMFDTIPETYWGGFITGDEITVNWDGGCACGRKGEFLHSGIGRLKDKVGSDDKVSCSGAPDLQKKASAYLAHRVSQLND